MSSFEPGAAYPSFNIPANEDYGVLQDLVDGLFGRSPLVSRIELITQAEIHDVSPEVMEVVELMPPGTYTRAQMADQMNSVITAHGWGMTLGTVE